MEPGFFLLPCPLRLRDLCVKSFFLWSVARAPRPQRFSVRFLPLSPPLLLHRRVLRFSLTPTSARNRIISKFRRFRRDSRSVVHGPFLEQLSSASSAKRAVRPRLVFLRSRGT